jgi:hypothetical protein
MALQFVDGSFWADKARFAPSERDLGNLQARWLVFNAPLVLV